MCEIKYKHSLRHTKATWRKKIPNSRNVFRHNVLLHRQDPQSAIEREASKNIGNDATAKYHEFHEKALDFESKLAGVCSLPRELYLFTKLWSIFYSWGTVEASEAVRNEIVWFHRFINCTGNANGFSKWFQIHTLNKNYLLYLIIIIQICLINYR